MLFSLIFLVNFNPENQQLLYDTFILINNSKNRRSEVNAY